MAFHNGNDLAQRVGSVYSEKDVLKLIEVTESGLYSMIASKDIFSVQTIAGNSFFPLFQFSGNKIRTDVISTIKKLETRNYWSVVFWLTSPTQENAKTPLERLDLGEAEAVFNNALEWSKS